MLVPGIAIFVRSVAMRRLRSPPWAENPMPPPITMPSRTTM
jgi:hypothetical protein